VDPGVRFPLHHPASQSGRRLAPPLQVHRRCCKKSRRVRAVAAMIKRGAGVVGLGAHGVTVDVGRRRRGGGPGW
jgi:hypothetical protein